MTDLRERLDDAIPEPPDTSGWASRAEAAAARRDRSRKAAGVGVAALAVVAAGVSVPLLRPHDQPMSGAPATGTPSAVSSTPAITSVSELGCPTSFGNPMDEPATLPTGAVAMRWCVDQSDPYWHPYGPPDVITEGVDSWISAYNALPALGSNAMCSADAATSSGAVLLYPDGSTKIVSGMPAGCHTIGTKRGFDEMAAKAINLVTAQRKSKGAPTVTIKPCSYTASWLMAGPDEITSSAVCSMDGRPKLLKRLDAAQTALLVADLQQNTVGKETTALADGPAVQLYSASGDFSSLQWSTTSKTWLVLGPKNAPTGVWKPGAQVQKLLEPYVS